jgi:hypothetical protein
MGITVPGDGIEEAKEGLPDENRWDEFCMAHSATTINENVVCWQYAVAEACGPEVFDLTGA